MKILLITSRFKPLVGGVEAIVETLAKNLSGEHDVTVITSLILDKYLENKFQGYNGYKKYKKVIIKIIFGLISIKSKDNTDDNYNIYRFWINLPRSFLGILAFPYRLIASTFSLIRFVKHERFDVINYHFPDDSAIYVYLLMKFIKIPLIVNIHGNDLHVFSNKRIYSFFIERILSKADKIVVNSEYMKQEFRKRFSKLSKKVVIIPNGIDVEEFRDIEPKPYFSKPYIFYVGRMVYKKGVDVLIRAFAKANIEGLYLFIEGKGEELEKNIQLAKDLGVYDKIEFGKGSLDAQTKIMYQKASLFGVIPSRIEPFGIVALEMMATGIPIIASKTGGLENILKNRRNCLFFENENVDDLANKIKELYEDAELRKKISENNLIDVKKYDHSMISREYEKLYNSVLR